MKKDNIILVLFLLTSLSLSGIESSLQDNDSIDVQKLYTGRVWKNTLYKIKGDQFLFSPEFLRGSVSIDSRKYKGIKLKYDIFNDEIITINDRGVLLQLNKEMIDSFSLSFNSHEYYFKKISPDTLGLLKGFVNILHDGGTGLYVKYSKEILPLAAENKYDLFNQVVRTYLVKDGKAYRITNRNGFLKQLDDRKTEIHNYIRNNKIKLSKREPDSFIPVVEFYDKIRL